jgi:hypothetical protein
VFGQVPKKINYMQKSGQVPKKIKECQKKEPRVPYMTPFLMEGGRRIRDRRWIGNANSRSGGLGEQ